MALEKQPIKINFAKGLNNKVDQKQLPVGNFQTLNNVTFGTLGEMKKRNGYAQQGTLSSNNYKNLTTLNDNLVTIGNTISTYSSANSTWTSKGTLLPGNFSALSLIKDQSQNIANYDFAYYQTGSNNGILAVIWTVINGTGTVWSGYFQFFDAVTGAPLTAATLINTVGGGFIAAAKVLYFNNYFVFSYVSGGDLVYFKIPVGTLTTSYTEVFLSIVGMPNLYSWDFATDDTKIYYSYQSTSSNLVRIFTLDSSFVKSSETAVTGSAYTTSSRNQNIVIDSANSRVYYLFIVDDDAKYFVYSTAGASVLGVTVLDSTRTCRSITGVLKSSTVYAFIDKLENLGIAASWNSTNNRADKIVYQACNASGTTGSLVFVGAGMGLMSKPILSSDGTDIYILVGYGLNTATCLQPSLFLLSILSGGNANSSTMGTIIGRFAYSNSGGYENNYVQLPSILNKTINSVTTFLFPYSVAFQSQAISKTSPSTSSGVYSQVGLNVGFIALNGQQLTKETAISLHTTGPLLTQFDTSNVVEDGFMVWPDDMKTTPFSGTGVLAAQQYYYKAVYEWTDKNGIIQRSAPGIPISANVIAPNDTVLIDIPFLRMTNKANVRLVLYRWSTAQPVYHQVTSITNPVNNDSDLPGADVQFQTFQDTYNDEMISGNTVLYTEGNVVENIPPGACFSPVLYRSRLMVVSSENPNQIWYSKQIIDATPVEFNDGFTLFVASGSSNSSTSPVKALGVLDDRLIVFKNNAIYYITGQGPDNTGANNDFSDPITISSPVGCSNPASIINTDVGLMFQASNGSGIWLLDRKLQVTYAGSAVANYNSYDVKSASLVPGTTEVRFNMSNGIILMYDFFNVVDQWGTFTNVPGDLGIASTISNGTYHYLSSAGQVWKETPGLYVDAGSNNILMNFKTGWLSLLGLQGYQRTYWVYLLGKYLTPHNFTVSLTYDYAQSAAQTVTVDPDSVAPTAGDLEQWRIFLTQQKCEALQIEFQEVYTSSQGASLTLSGLNLIVGAKLHYPKNDFSGSAS